MGWIIAAAIVGVIAFFVLGYKDGAWKIRSRQLAALFALILVLPSMFATVPTGHTGIVTMFGAVKNNTLEAGLHVKSPLVQVVCMDNRTQKATINMVCYTSDIQEVTILYTINYQIEKANAQNIFKRIGANYYETVMQPRIMDGVKSVIARYSAESLIASREELSTKIAEKLENDLAEYNIIVINAAIEDMDFSDAYTEAVEQKQVAEQNKLKSQIEQQQMLLVAEAEASKKKIAAAAEAEVAKIEADAAKYAGEKEAEMNKKLSETLTKDLIDYYYIQHWDGKLPSIVGSDTVLPILNTDIEK